MDWVAIGLLGFGLLPRKWYPPTLLLLLDADKYEESEATYKIISERLKVIDGLGYVAI